MQNTEYKKTITPNDPGAYCDAMALHSGLAKSRIKKAMVQGAAWIQRPGKKLRRIRRATAAVKPGDVIRLYYNEAIMALVPPKARCLKDLGAYSIWFKPAGLMSQGTRYGDHCALLRQVESAFRPKRRALPVHRLDREAAGLIMVAHHRKAAAALSNLFRTGRIEKYYQVRVLGDLSQYGAEQTISFELDNRQAITRYKLIAYDAHRGQSLAQVRIVTGRRHQIRRHFDMIGHPVIGDPRYGDANKNKTGMRLTATGLAFTCPLGHGPIQLQIDPDKIE